jgi:hypothetical protein
MAAMKAYTQDTGGEWGVLLAAVATPLAGRDQSGPYPMAMRHQYPERRSDEV